ncbi:MAG: ATP-binding protein [Phocaeicola sp.]
MVICIYRFRYHLVFLLVSVLMMLPAAVLATDPISSTILVISSYNPETRHVSENISDFIKTYESLGGKSTIVVESLNCKNLSEASEWRSRLELILDKYKGKHTPCLIALFGQEAWASYLSIDTEYVKQIPIVSGMVSRNLVQIPSGPFDIVNWEPESKDALTDFADYNIVGGLLYEYRIDKNIELIESFFPQTKQVFFLTDNTYGGVAFQALIKEQMKSYSHLEMLFLDGRKLSLMEVSEAIVNMKKDASLLFCSWRIDSTEKYILNSNLITYGLNSNLPIFTASSLKTNSWIIGGYTPYYQDTGGQMAEVAFNFLSTSSSLRPGLELISSRYIFDMSRLADFDLADRVLPAGSQVINAPPSVYDQYKYTIIAILAFFVLVVVCFAIGLYYIVRINRLKRNLQRSSKELTEAKELAEESNKLKTAFLANLSHEIRTPLNAIVGFSQVLTSRDSSEAEKSQYCEIILKNSDLLLHLINDILDISRLESGRLKLFKERCDLNQLCQTALSTVEYTRRTKAEFFLEMPQEELHIQTDSQRFQQVLINLLTNAAKFTPHGTITLTVTKEHAENRILVRVKDTGCGVPPEKSELIFERFEKLNEYTQGTGLGLSICRVIVAQLGGQIWLDNAYKDGACFVFTHPLQPHVGVNEEQ